VGYLVTRVRRGRIVLGERFAFDTVFLAFAVALLGLVGLLAVLYLAGRFPVTAAG